MAALVIVPVGAAWLLGPNPSNEAARLRAYLRGVHVHPVSLTGVAPVLREAVVATEDERFWRNHGIDLVGVARAAAWDLSHLSLAQGGSTITEQLVKQLYLSGNDHSPWRKLEDAVAALRLGLHAPKDGVLQDYLNVVYFGDGAYGVRAASRRYFGARPADLTLPQASMLAGLIQDPFLYDPYTDADAARLRQADVLKSMVRDGYITIPEGERALQTPLPLADGKIVPPLMGVSIAPGQELSVSLALAGLALLCAALLARAVLRRLPIPRVARLSWLAVAAVGVVVLARSLQFA